MAVGAGTRIGMEGTKVVAAALGSNKTLTAVELLRGCNVHLAVQFGVSIWYGCWCRQ